MVSWERRVTVVSSVAGVLIFPLMKQFRDRPFPLPGSTAFEPGLRVKR